MDATNIVLFILLCISVPVYSIFLISIIKYRKYEPFNCAFFAICFILGVFDISSLIRTWVLIRFPTHGWLGLDLVVKHWRKPLAKLSYTGWAYIGTAQFNLVLLMAANRYTAIVKPFKHRNMWNRKRTMKILLALLILPLFLYVPPQFFIHHDYIVNNGTGKVEGIHVTDRTMLLVVTAFAVFFNGIATTCISGFLYGIAYWKRRKQLIKQRTIKVGRNKKGNKTDIKLAFVGFALFVIQSTLLVGKIVNLAQQPNTERYLSLQKKLLVLNDFFGWVNVWLILVVSKSVRKRFVATLFWKNAQTAVQPTN